ncbi:MAG: hypothetical protein RSB98_06620, partial [Raoultibacter sp.]
GQRVTGFAVTTQWGSLDRGQRVTGAALGHDAVGSLNLRRARDRLRGHDAVYFKAKPFLLLSL